jgi:branched-chain amino acid transport system ATP-binding protein
MSHGQKRLLEIFLACAARPAVIFADEPLAGLAPDRIPWCVETLNSFSNSDGALLIVAHQRELEHWKVNWHREVHPA